MQDRILKLETVETDDFLFTPQLKAENYFQIYTAKPKRSIRDTSAVPLEAFIESPATRKQATTAK